MSYFDTLPIELSTQIVSYLKYDDLLKLEASTDNLKIDWFHLFLIRYPKIYRININEYNIENICRDLLRCHYIIDRDTQEIIYNYFITAPMFRPEINKDTIGYLFKNNFIYPTIKLISILDNVDIFLQFESMLKYVEYIIFLKYNSLNILQYIFDKKVSDWFRNDNLWFDALRYYNDTSGGDLEITKILINHFKNDNVKLLILFERSMNCDAKINRYIFDSITLGGLRAHNVNYTLKSIFCNKKENMHDTYMNVYHKFNTLIDINEHYLQLVNDGKLYFYENEENILARLKIRKFLKEKLDILSYIH